jgi:hypothetical protein
MESTLAYVRSTEEEMSNHAFIWRSVHLVEVLFQDLLCLG